jgi:hypothetical protein
MVCKVFGTGSAPLETVCAGASAPPCAPVTARGTVSRVASPSRPSANCWGRAPHVCERARDAGSRFPAHCAAHGSAAGSGGALARVHKRAGASRRGRERLRDAGARRCRFANGCETPGRGDVALRTDPDPRRAAMSLCERIQAPRRAAMSLCERIQAPRRAAMSLCERIQAPRRAAMSLCERAQARHAFCRPSSWMYAPPVCSSSVPRRRPCEWRARPADAQSHRLSIPPAA